MSFEIREATPEDASTIVELVAELCAFEGKSRDEVNLTEEIVLRDGFGDSPSFSCLLANLDGEPIGYSIYSIRFSAWQGTSVLYIEDIFIQPNHRKKGYGLEMMRRLAEIAIQRNCKFIEGLAYDWNTSAMTLYDQLGAKAQKQLVVYRWDTENYEKLTKL